MKRVKEEPISTEDFRRAVEGAAGLFESHGFKRAPQFEKENAHRGFHDLCR